MNKEMRNFLYNNKPDVIKKDNEGNIILRGWNIGSKKLKKLIKEHKTNKGNKRS